MQSLGLCLAGILFISFGALADDDSKDSGYWLARIKDNPEDSKNFLNLGVWYHKNGKHKSAYKAYKQVIALNGPLSPVAHYYTAKLYAKIGKVNKASHALDQIKIQSMPPKLRRRILTLREELIPKEELSAPTEAPKDEEARFSAFVEASYGPNNNPAFEADVENENINQLMFDTNMSYLLSAGDTHEVRIRHLFNDTAFAEYESANTGYHGLYLPLAYYTENFRYRLTPEYVHNYYAGEDFSHSYGASFDVSFNRDKNSYTLALQNLELGVADLDTYDYLVGSSQNLRVTWQRRFEGAMLATNIDYSLFNYDDNESITSSYTSPALSFDYTLYLENIDLSASTSIEFKTYNEDADGDIREDTLISANLQVGRNMQEYLRLFIDLTYSDNASNASDDEYTQTIATLGLSSGI